MPVSQKTNVLILSNATFRFIFLAECRAMYNMPENYEHLEGEITSTGKTFFSIRNILLKL